MMIKDCMSGVCRTVLDNIKDADMQLDWAEAAKERGNHELAQFHAEEAKSRLRTAKEWYDRGVKMHEQSGGGKMDPLTEALIEREREHYHEIMNRAANFKPGA
jgi:hypothetical protein